MYHICHSKNKQFYVVNIGGNGKVINQSETLTTRRACHKNIAANMKSVFGSEASCHTIVQDDTKKGKLAYTVWDNGTVGVPAFALEPRYIPGKNKNSVKTPIVKKKKKS